VKYSYTEKLYTDSVTLCHHNYHEYKFLELLGLMKSIQHNTYSCRNEVTLMFPLLTLDFKIACQVFRDPVWLTGDLFGAAS
jgi:hypothetical protein